MASLIKQRLLQQEKQRTDLRKEVGAVAGRARIEERTDPQVKAKLLSSRRLVKVRRQAPVVQPSAAEEVLQKPVEIYFSDPRKAWGYRKGVEVVVDPKSPLYGRTRRSLSGVQLGQAEAEYYANLAGEDVRSFERMAAQAGAFAPRQAVGFYGEKGRALETAQILSGPTRGGAIRQRQQEFLQAAEQAREAGGLVTRRVDTGEIVGYEFPTFETPTTAAEATRIYGGVRTQEGEMIGRARPIKSTPYGVQFVGAPPPTYTGLRIDKPIEYEFLEDQPIVSRDVIRASDEEFFFGAATQRQLTRVKKAVEEERGIYEEYKRTGFITYVPPALEFPQDIKYPFYPDMPRQKGFELDLLDVSYAREPSLGYQYAVGEGEKPRAEYPYSEEGLRVLQKRIGLSKELEAKTFEKYALVGARTEEQFVASVEKMQDYLEAKPAQIIPKIGEGAAIGAGIGFAFGGPAGAGAGAVYGAIGGATGQLARSTTIYLSPQRGRERVFGIQTKDLAEVGGFILGAGFPKIPSAFRFGARGISKLRIRASPFKTVFYKPDVGKIVLAPTKKDAFAFVQYEKGLPVLYGRAEQNVIQQLKAAAQQQAFRGATVVRYRPDFRIFKPALPAPSPITRSVWYGLPAPKPSPYVLAKPYELKGIQAFGDFYKNLRKTTAISYRKYLPQIKESKALQLDLLRLQERAELTKVLKVAQIRYAQKYVLPKPTPLAIGKFKRTFPRKSLPSFKGAKNILGINLEKERKLAIERLRQERIAKIARENLKRFESQIKQAELERQLLKDAERLRRALGWKTFKKPPKKPKVLFKEEPVFKEVKGARTTTVLLEKTQTKTSKELSKTINALQRSSKQSLASLTAKPTYAKTTLGLAFRRRAVLPVNIFALLRPQASLARQLKLPKLRVRDREAFKELEIEKQREGVSEAFAQAQTYGFGEAERVIEKQAEIEAQAQSQAKTQYRTFTQTATRSMPKRVRRPRRGAIEDFKIYGEKKQLYHAYVREGAAKKKPVWVKVTRQPLTRNAAWNKGFMVADNTTGRSVTVKPVGLKRTLMIDDPFQQKQKFRRKAKRSKIGNEPVLIEKNLFTIDTIGEKNQLSVARYKARQKRIWGL